MHCIGLLQRRRLQCMSRRTLSNLPALSTIWGVLLFMALPECAIAEPPAAAVSAFNIYASAVDVRLGQQHHSQSAFIVPLTSASQDDAHLRGGELIIEQLTPSTAADLPG